MGRDAGDVRRRCGAAAFQSTRPAWGATSSPTLRSVSGRHFNPRAPHGARPAAQAAEPAPRLNFNPRAPHGARLLFHGSLHGKQNFNPRAPHGARQIIPQHLPINKEISIHAPRMGRDRIRGFAGIRNNNFNPRAPHGARLTACRGFSRQSVISIHAPRMGRDFHEPVSVVPLLPISIHAPRMGRDMSTSPRIA